MPGPIRVGAPTRIRHIPLSWPVEKARSNHQPKFRPVNDTVLRGREVTVGEVMEQMFAAMPSPNDWIDGTSDAGAYYQEATEVAEPFRVRIAEMLQVTFNEGALLGQDSIRADINVQLERLGSPLRLTGEDGRVTKRRGARVEEVAVEHLGRNPKSKWAPIGVEAFDVVDAKSVQYAQFRSGTLVTNMVEEQQRVIRGLIGESFTVQQTFQTGRTVTGLTAQQTAHALVEVLQEVNPTSQIGQNLAKFRGVNANGLTRPWEKAVYRRAETLADRLGRQGVTGVKAQMRIQKDAQRYADKLRRSRARMISRTEIKNAQVQGRLESFRQTVNDGLADPATAGKQWVTGATDVCSICSELGMSKPISLDNSFEGGFDGPTAHPNCRCDVMFVHDIATPPKAVPAGNPDFRPGTPENPITWEFPSGFKTQPSATTAFTPPGFAPPPPAPPPPPKPPSPQPAEPPPPVEVAPTPAQTGPVSNADLVWDDAGRKWADLTESEQLFLLERHADDIVAQAYDDITGALIAEANPAATRPTLPADASDEMKAISAQIDKVDELKAQQAQYKVESHSIMHNKESGEFSGWIGRFDEEIYEWAEMPEGYVPRFEGMHPGTGMKGKTKAVIAIDDAGGIPLPGSTRQLTYIRQTGWDIADPDAPLTHTFINNAYHRLTKGRFPTRGDLPPNVLAELEKEITKLGTMVREEAARRGGVDVVDGFVGQARSWLNTTELKTGKPSDAVVAHRNITRQIDEATERLAEERIWFVRETEDRIPGVTGLDSLPADELFGGRLPTARHLRTGKTAAGEPLHEIDRVLARAIHEPYQQAVEEFVQETLERIGFAQFDPNESGRILIQVRNGFTRAGKHADPAYVATEQIAEAIKVMVQQGKLSVDDALTMLNPHLGPGTLNGRLGSHLVGTAAKRHAQARAIIHESLGDSGWINAASGLGELPVVQVVDDLVRQVDHFWDGGKWGGPRGATGEQLAGLAINEARLPLWEEFAKLTEALGRGNADEVAQTVLGRISGITVESEQDIRVLVNEVMQELRYFGDDTFDIGLGIGNGSGKTSMAVLDDAARESLRLMEEAVEDWMPSDWVVRSNERGQLGIIKGGDSRGAYGDAGHYSLQHQGAYMRTGNGIIHISDDGLGQSTMLHEVTHRAQRASPLHQDVERAWVERRVLETVDSQARRLRPMKELRPGGGYDAWEKAFEDEFLRPYIGKFYGGIDDGYLKITQRGRNKWIKGDPISGQFSESSTMAMEHLAGLPGGSHGNLMADPDMVDWWLGMLLGI